MTDKPNCYKCKFRGSVAGSRHSCCHVLDSMKLELWKECITAAAVLTNMSTLMRFNQHGIDKGWVLWPYDFDPVWLNYCWFYDQTYRKEVMQDAETSIDDGGHQE